MKYDKYLDKLLNKTINTKNQLKANEYIRLARNYVYETNKYTNLEKFNYLALIDKVAESRNLPI